MIVLGTLLGIIGLLINEGANILLTLTTRLSSSLSYSSNNFTFAYNTYIFVFIFTVFIKIVLSIVALVIFVYGFYKETKQTPVEADNAYKKTYPVSLNIVTCVLLSIVTLGIYYIFWEYQLVKGLKALKNDESRCTGEILCLIFVPFYNLYWWYTRGQSVQEEFSKRNYSSSGNGIVYLILGLFGLGIISAAIMQKDFNSISESEEQNSLNSKDFCVLSACFSAFGILSFIIPIGFGFISLALFIAATAIGYKAKKQSLTDKQVNPKLANQLFIAGIIGIIGALSILAYSVFSLIEILSIKTL